LGGGMTRLAEVCVADAVEEALGLARAARILEGPHVVGAHGAERQTVVEDEAGEDEVHGRAHQRHAPAAVAAPRVRTWGGPSPVRAVTFGQV
jgi:hypothetical protein